MPKQSKTKKILYLAEASSPSSKTHIAYLEGKGHQVEAPELPEDDFDEAVKIAEAHSRQNSPDVIVGWSFGGAVAMNISDNVRPTILLCPAWKQHGTAATAKLGTIIIHAKNDETTPISDSYELVKNSDLQRNTVVPIGRDHNLSDEASLETLLEAILAPWVEVKAGLAAYYSCIAQSALDRFDTVRHLLGATSDWTAPGTACEVLIRELVRTVTPSRFSVDKGFIHGRRILGGTTVHSPEVDVLVHDTHNYAPLLRIDEFVIVQPAAVVGVVQVKRTLTSQKLKKAIDNVVKAKQHIYECTRASVSARQQDEIFSAVIAFQDEIPKPKGRISLTYKNKLKAAFEDAPNGGFAPQFVGALSNIAFAFNGGHGPRIGYSAYKCEHPTNDGRSPINFGIQIFLYLLTHSMLSHGRTPPFAFPEKFPEIDFLSMSKTV